MNISLTKTLEDFVQAKVASGMYTSASEVVRAGLRALAEQELQRNIQIGLNEANQGLGTEFNDEFAENLIANIQKRVAAKQTK